MLTLFDSVEEHSVLVSFNLKCAQYNAVSIWTEHTQISVVFKDL